MIFFSFFLRNSKSITVTIPGHVSKEIHHEFSGEFRDQCLEKSWRNNYKTSWKKNMKQIREKFMGEFQQKPMEEFQDNPWKIYGSISCNIFGMCKYFQRNFYRISGRTLGRMPKGILRKVLYDSLNTNNVQKISGKNL